MLWLLHGNLGSPADWKPVMDALRSNGIESRALNLWKYLECCPKSLPEMGACFALKSPRRTSTPISAAIPWEEGWPCTRFWRIPPLEGSRVRQRQSRPGE